MTWHSIMLAANLHQRPAPRPIPAGLDRKNHRHLYSAGLSGLIGFARQCLRALARAGTSATVACDPPALGRRSLLLRALPIHQGRLGHAERARNPLQNVQRDVAVTVLHAGEVGHMDIGSVRELILWEPARFALTSDVLTNEHPQFHRRTTADGALAAE